MWVWSVSRLWTSQDSRLIVNINRECLSNGQVHLNVGEARLGLG